MEIQNTIDVLNKLITINDDRIEDYKTASKETEQQYLKTLFAHFGTTSEKCNKELAAEVTKLGGTPAEGTKTTGKFFRLWMDVKTVLTSNDRKAILNSCKYGEDVAIETYETALKNDAKNLIAQQQDMIKAQLTTLKADHDKVKSMRDLSMEA